MTIKTLSAAAVVLTALAGPSHADTALNASALCKTVQASFPGSKVTISGPNKMRVACPGSRDAVKISVHMDSLDEMHKAAAGQWKPDDSN